MRPDTGDTATRDSAVGYALTNSGLFNGQSKAFFNLLFSLA